MKTGIFINRRRIFCAAIISSIFCLAAILPAGCESGEPPAEVETTLALSSTAFLDGGSIPDRYTCDGQDISPQLSWGEPPAGTQSLALVMDDIDTSGRFTHWVILNIPPNSRGLPEAMPAQPRLSDGALQGKNDFGDIGYGGPCPPYGKSHRYRFILYALDGTLNLEAGVSKKQVLDATEGHILARGQLTSTYQR